MKSKYCLTLCIGVAIAVAACKEKEVDSKFITVSSPTPHQRINDKDSVVIEAIIKPQNTTVISYSVSVKTKNDKILFTTNRSCDCKLVKEVKMRESFLYDIDQTSDVFLEIVAVMADNSETREKVPFILQN